MWRRRSTLFWRIARSWGTVLMGRYASQHKDRVHRLVLYAPVWLHDPPTQGSLPPLGAYRTWTMDDARKTLQAGAPEARKDELLPPNVFAAWVGGSCNHTG